MGQKVSARRELFAPGGEAVALLNLLQNILVESSTGYVVPKAGLTVADLMYFCVFNTIRSGFIEGIRADVFKDYPKIMAHKEKIAGIPAIKGYYADKGRSNPCDLPNYDVFKPENGH